MSQFTEVKERVRKAMDKPPIAEAEAGPLACNAVGCPCVGTVDIGNTKRSCCSWHAWDVGSQWPSITDALLQNRWMIDHIGELQRLHRAAGKGEPWLELARSFWRDEPDMQPQPIEANRWNAYLWRLREDLAYRVGSRKDKPSPLIPRGWRWRGSESRLPMREPGEEG